jgi:hypothetical protein
MAKLTEWFNFDAKPWHRGVYDVRDCNGAVSRASSLLTIKAFYEQPTYADSKIPLITWVWIRYQGDLGVAGGCQSRLWYGEHPQVWACGIQYCREQVPSHDLDKLPARYRLYQVYRHA